MGGGPRFSLKIIASKGSWYKVRDFENDVGWVYAPLISRKAHLVVKKPVINIRSGPGTNFRIVTQAKYGVVFRTEKRVKGWVRVRHESGVTGWVARRLCGAGNQAAESPLVARPWPVYVRRN